VYALIAIGDGLASQIPSLAVTLAAGIVVTRVAPELSQDGLGTELGRQFFGRAQVLGVVAGLCLSLALMPGMPAAPFLLLGVGAGALGWTRARSEVREGAGSAPGAEEGHTEPPRAGAGEAGALHRDASEVPSPLTLELATDLSVLAQDPEGFVHGELEALRDA